MSFPLLLVLILLVLSWLSVHLIEQQNIFRSWLTPVNQRMKEFTIGFILMGALCLISHLFFSFINDVSWSLSAEITLSKFLSATLANVNSVLIEELIFRGVLLYALVKYASEPAGLLLSSAAFGIYHWFSYGVLGNPLGMALVFITTGVMGYVFAKAYVKTTSVVLPVGLHLGWNWVNGSIFSNGPNGTVLLVPDQTVAMEGAFAMISFVWYLLLPIVVLFLLKTDVFERLRMAPSTGITK